MHRWQRLLVIGLLFSMLAGAVGYLGYVGYEASRVLVSDDGMDPRCDTPDVQFGWEYEAINYDIADDRALIDRNTDLQHCTYLGDKAGDEIVTPDGVRIAGWYIPAANGTGPGGPTVVLVHGFKGNKSGILEYGEALHDEFNLVAFDMRNTGRSTGTETTAGVLEQQDLRAVIDWLERTKGPTQIGVIGNSLGAATALAEIRDDARVDAVVLDSMHTRLRYQMEARVAARGYPASFATDLAIIFGTWLRTGVDIGSIDAEDIWPGLGNRPVLITHGTADEEDLAPRTQAFYEELRGAGITVGIEWCPDAGHRAEAGMPVDVCRAEFGAWVSEFFDDTLGGESAR
jgi:pimeloyl-ACP methyl ester carboxylesterase